MPRCCCGCGSPHQCIAKYKSSQGLQQTVATPEQYFSNSQNRGSINLYTATQSYPNFSNRPSSQFNRPLEDTYGVNQTINTRQSDFLTSPNTTQPPLQNQAIEPRAQSIQENIPLNQLYPQQENSQLHSQQPTFQQSNYQQPISQQSNYQQSIAQQSNYQQSIAHQSNYQQPIAQQSNYQQSIAQQSNYQQSIAQQSNYQQPINQQSNYQQPINQQSNYKQQDPINSVPDMSNQQQQQQQYGQPNQPIRNSLQQPVPPGSQRNSTSFARQTNMAPTYQEVGRSTNPTSRQSYSPYGGPQRPGTYPQQQSMQQSYQPSPPTYTIVNIPQQQPTIRKTEIPLPLDFIQEQETGNGCGCPKKKTYTIKIPSCKKPANCISSCGTVLVPDNPCFPCNPCAPCPPSPCVPYTIKIPTCQTPPCDTVLVPDDPCNPCKNVRTLVFRIPTPPTNDSTRQSTASTRESTDQKPKEDSDNSDDRKSKKSKDKSKSDKKKKSKKESSDESSEDEDDKKKKKDKKRKSKEKEKSNDKSGKRDSVESKNDVSIKS